MDALTPASPVHYFDTTLHRIACGVRGSDHRSTKHSRDVTCDACLGLLRDAPTLASAAGAATGGAAS